MKYLIVLFFMPFLASSEVPTQIKTVQSDQHTFRVEELLSGLQIPWGFEFLSSHQMLILEKNGQMSFFDLAQDRLTKITNAPKVVDRGQGGALDIVKHPNYPKVPWLYMTYVDSVKGVLTTVLARFQLKKNKVIQFENLLVAKAGTDTTRHFGSRIVFDGKGYLYFSIGDRGHRPNGQDLSTHAGSIMRLHDDGRVPKDNPFVAVKGALPEIWSYGHRNPQGLAYDAKERKLWAIEHGPRGGDEINLIQKGLNYGWPIISYGKEYHLPKPVGEGTHKKGMQQPIHYYIPSIAPCGMILYRGSKFKHWNGNLLTGALKLTHLNRVVIKGDKFKKEERLIGDLNERIRQVKQGPDELIYFSTDSGKIFRLVPANKAKSAKDKKSKP